MFFLNSTTIQGAPLLCNKRYNPHIFTSTEFSLPMNMYSRHIKKPDKRIGISASNPSSSANGGNNEDASILKRKRRFFPDTPVSTANKKPINQLEPSAKRAPIVFDLDNDAPSTQQMLPVKRAPIKITFNAAKLKLQTSGTRIGTLDESNKKYFPAQPKKNLESKTSTLDEGNNELSPAQSNKSRPSESRIISFNYDEHEPEFFPSNSKKNILLEKKTSVFEEIKKKCFPSQPKKSRLSDTKLTAPDESKTEFFPSQPKKSRLSDTKLTAPDESKTEFFPSQSRKRKSSESKRAPITYDLKDDTPKSESNKRLSLHSIISSRHNDKKSRESFFNSPATPRYDKYKFKNPPVYKGKDGRYYVAFFTNKYIFSNHFVCPSGVTVDDMEFPTTEHYYMYSKALFHNDTNAAKRIQKCEDPKEAKRITTKFEGFDTNGWKKIQYKVMEKACLAKFRQNPELRRELFRTCDAVLVEASPSDQRWGIGLNMDNKDVADESKWRGSNLLGKLLTNVRAKLATEYGEEFENEFEDGKKDLKRRAIKC